MGTSAGETSSWGKCKRKRTSAMAKAILPPSSSLGMDSPPTAETTTSTPATSTTSLRAASAPDIVTQDCAAGLPSSSGSAAVAVVGEVDMTTGPACAAGTDEAACKGVRQRGSKWVAEIRNRFIRGGSTPGRRWLGTFDTREEAIAAYQKAVNKIKCPPRKRARGPGRPRGTSKPLITLPPRKRARAAGSPQVQRLQALLGAAQTRTLTSTPAAAAVPSSLCFVAADDCSGSKRAPESVSEFWKPPSKQTWRSINPAFWLVPGTSGSVGPGPQKLKVPTGLVASAPREDADKGPEGDNGSAPLFEKGGAVAMLSSPVAPPLRAVPPPSVPPSVPSAEKPKRADECEGARDQSLIEDSSLLFSCERPNLDDVMGCIPAAATPVRVRCNCHPACSTVIEQVGHPSPECTAFLFLAQEQRCSPWPAAGPSRCSCGCQSYGEADMQAWIDFHMKRFETEKEYAVFKTAYLVSELSPPEARRAGIRRSWNDYCSDGGDFYKRSSPVLESCSPASFSVWTSGRCDAPSRRVHFVELLSDSQFELLFKSQLILADFLTHDVLGLDILGSEFSPVEELLRYFSRTVIPLPGVLKN